MNPNPCELRPVWLTNIDHGNILRKSMASYSALEQARGNIVSGQIKCTLSRWNAGNKELPSKRPCSTKAQESYNQCPQAPSNFPCTRLVRDVSSEVPAGRTSPGGSPGRLRTATALPPAALDPAKDGCWTQKMQGVCVCVCVRACVRFCGSLRSLGCGSKPCTPGEHQHRWQMDVHPPQNRAIGSTPWPLDFVLKGKPKGLPPFGAPNKHTPT